MPTSSADAPVRPGPLLEIERLAAAWGRAFVVRGVPAKLAALAKLYGIEQLLLRPETAAAVDQRKPAT